MSARARAVREQLSASDPAVSAFVAASAGSGKTKLLTDRMLRLMLGGAREGALPGVHPGRLQCLTFTKAAAAEMALRLQHRLGRWVTLDDAALDAELEALMVVPSDAVRGAARALFATVLDLPGGMRIGTIHAFCQGLLRRFPLEAAISPHFQLVEEVEAEAEMRVAREDVLARADAGSVATVAALVRADDFAEVVHAMQGQRARLAPLMARPEPARDLLVRRAAGCVHDSDAEVLAAGVEWADEGDIEAALRRMQSEGSATVRERAMDMLAWLSLPAAERAEHWGGWLLGYVTKDGSPRSWGTFPNKVLDKAHPWIRSALVAEQERVMAVEAARAGLRGAEASAALLRLVAPALDAYAAAKERGGLLDYSDLIGRTERLLEDPGAGWVLFKLDGGIDHLLLDEVQDTAPEQWRIAHRLTEEFFAGLGTREGDGRGGVARTFFAVGDPKQSIYSFQGADPDEFTRSRERMAGRVGQSGQVWRDVSLDVSFRSTGPVLALVDAVFADPVAADGVADAGGLHHEADRAGAAGRVELWPLAPPPESAPPQDWVIPAENQGLVSAPQRLAEGIARAIADMLARGEPLVSQGRALEAGDILVLVRRRGPFATALVRALKSCGVPVAGLDRLALTEQAAVQDLLAACDAVLLPEDCLSVACVLTSPLGGLTDESLMALALGREGRLFETLRRRAGERADWAAAYGFIASLAERADYVTPHALLAEALGRLGGRARLLARLGAEAAEPIDELLNAALAYTRLHAPSLQGFVHWMRRSGAEVKREAGGAGSAVRVMTAHGAKGLQAPLVVLPDTAGLPPDRDDVVWHMLDEGGGLDGIAGALGTPAEGAPGAEPVEGAPGAALWVPLWAPRKELRGAAWLQASAAGRSLRMREYNRLLYVALTRAEDRLIVCGWAPKRGEAPDASWYALARRGFERLGAAAVEFAGVFPGAWEGDMLVLESAQTGPVGAAGAGSASVGAGAAGVAAGRPGAALPAWAGRPGNWRTAAPPDEPVLPRPLAPSRPEGAHYGPVPPGLSPFSGRGGASQDGLGRFARGAAVHALLQHLPALPADGWAAAAEAWLLRAGLGADQQALAAQVLGVLRLPELAALFGPGGRAEQPVSGLLGDQVVSGVVDRMVVLPDRVVIADFKTGRGAPAAVADTPVRYVRQLAAYRAVLRALFPGRPVVCWLVWTEGAVATLLPDGLLDLHAPGIGRAGGGRVGVGRA